MSAQLRLPFVFPYHPSIPAIPLSKVLSLRRRRAANSASRLIASVTQQAQVEDLAGRVIELIAARASHSVISHFDELAQLLDGVQSNTDESPAQLARNLLLHLQSLKKT